MDDTQNGVLQKPLLVQQEEFPATLSHKLTSESTLFPGLDSGNGLIDSERHAPSCTVEWIWREMQKQLYIAGPMVCVFLLQSSLLMISGMVVGHLGELELAGVSMATQFGAMTGTSLLIGMAGALETFCGQAYGAKQYHMLGVYLQRAVLVLNLISLPVALVWWNVSPLLQLLGQDPLISELAGQYARCLIPMLFGVATFQPLVRFLQTQSVVLPLPLLAITIITLHVPLCWLLVYNIGLGFRGAAIACSISNWLTVLFLALFVKFSATCKKTWTSFSREAVFNDLPAFLRIAIPSAGMYCLDLWSFEGMVIVAGLLPNAELQTSTLSICITTANILYTIPYGISAAVSTRVSNELGAGQPGAARAAVAVGVGMSLTEGVLMATLLYTDRHVWGWAFTGDQEVVDSVANCIPFVACALLVDSFAGVLCGVARGCGWQAAGAAGNLAAFYMVGWPAAVVLAFVYDLKVTGLCMGLLLGILVQGVTYGMLTIITDWEKQAEVALRRVRRATDVATLALIANEIACKV